MKKIFFKTAKELSENFSLDNEFKFENHLIFNSPAALDFNSPGAQGFGVKRAGLSVPDSIMLLVAPRSCGRNTASLKAPTHRNERERFAWLLLDEIDIITGRYLNKIPEAVEKFVASRKNLNVSVVMLCVTCVDALLGTDMERICKRCQEKVNLPVRPCYMYALTRDSKRPPMVLVREEIFSLLNLNEGDKKNPRQINLLGYFSKISETSELFEILKTFGFQKICELATCDTYEEFQEMAKANVNLIFHQEMRDAAYLLEKKLHTPFIELVRLYRLGKIFSQYQSLANVFPLSEKNREAFQKMNEEFYFETKEIAEKMKKFAQEKNLSAVVGSRLNANPFELSLALSDYGFEIKKIFAEPTPQDLIYIKKLAQKNSETKIFTNLSPSMFYFDGAQDEEKIDVAFGADACFYYRDSATKQIPWNDEVQPFGYDALQTLFKKIFEAF